MKNYIISGHPLEYYNAVAITKPLTDGAYALSGMFDMPSRDGDTERAWGTSVEPFVEEADIKWSGRTLSLYLYVDKNNLQSLINGVIEQRNLGTPFGDYEVITKDSIEVEDLCNCDGSLVSVTFWQSEVSFSKLEVKASGGEGYKIDNFNLANDFKISVTGRKNDCSVGPRLEIGSTMESFVTRYREPVNLELECTIIDSNPGYYIEQFKALLARKGLRNIVLSNGRTLKGYCKDGFSVNTGHQNVFTFTLKLRIAE